MTSRSSQFFCPLFFLPSGNLDGLYVLLRPAKKSRGKHQLADVPKAPAHLQHLVWENGDNVPETCPWSLSGPQFPQPTAIQQRYCYPKGKAEYSSRIGGALWTMYGRDKKEDLDFRLLHGKFLAMLTFSQVVHLLSILRYTLIALIRC